MQRNDGVTTCPPMDSYIVAQQGPQPGIGALTPDGVKTCRAIEDCPHPQECGKAGGCERNDALRNAGVPVAETQQGGSDGR